MEREVLFIKKMKETADLAYRRGIVSFSDFLDLYEIHMIHSVNWKEHGVSLCLSGGYDTAERQMAAFLPDALSYEWEYPFTCVKISASALKFSLPMSHRDYLGAVLGLGIERRVIGDILAGEREAFLFCEDSMVSFLQSELHTVGRNAVTVSLCTDPGEIPLPREEEITGTVASPRLDAVIALAFHGSRSSLLPLIGEGKVFVNGRQIPTGGFTLNPGDLVSVRGCGKFRFDGCTAKTRKGRSLIRLYRYI